MGMGDLLEVWPRRTRGCSRLSTADGILVWYRSQAFCRHNRLFFCTCVKSPLCLFLGWPMPDLKQTSYDVGPYESYPVARCRVLELGCAAGGNLLPMAVALPDSTFLGLDLSSRQIADGQKVVDDLGLKNVTLQHRSILDVTP